MTRKPAILLLLSFLFLVVTLVQSYLDSPKDENSGPLRGPLSDEYLFDNTYVLAISWQPAFCETRPRKPECINQGSDRFDGTNFSLHGLWPEPIDNVYCGVASHLRSLDEAGHWHRLPELKLSHGVQDELGSVMPGRQSHLDRHEWIKHGTCYLDATPEVYFSHSLALIEEINRSQVRDLFASSIGRRLNLEQIQGAFDAAFGPGTGMRVRLSCAEDEPRDLIVELRINLKGQISTPPDLSALLLAAPKARSTCQGGIVDPAGLQ